MVSLDGLKLICKFVHRPDFALISLLLHADHSLDLLGIQEAHENAVSSYLALQACISLCCVSDRSDALLLLPCSHKHVIAHMVSLEASFQKVKKAQEPIRTRKQEQLEVFHQIASTTVFQESPRVTILVTI